MSELRLVKMEDDQEIPSCGEASIDSMIQKSFIKTLYKQGLAYNILVDNVLVGNCMIKFVWLEDEDADYYDEHLDFIALEISYLAIDLRFQKHGFGSSALNALIQMAKQISSELPVRFLVINAFEKWVPWYTKAGFAPYPKKEDPRYPNCVPMRMDLIDMERVAKYTESYCS